MRNAFADEITKLAATDPRIVVLSGDIGNRMFDKFKDANPERFYNCGVAEANMTGVAAGMALDGLRPFTYTIVPFATTRCLEQIRVDVCYHNLPVTIVGTGGGLSYASLGATHHSCEDIAFLRALPNMLVICPADAVEVRLAIRAVLRQDNPAYIRLGKKGERIVHQSEPDFRIGRGIVLREGHDVCLIGTGNILPAAVDVADALAQKGHKAKVISLHTVKPLDGELLKDVFANYKLVVSLEEHSLIGGLGSALGEWLADNGYHGAKLLRFGTGDTFMHESGGQSYARKYFGIDTDSITKKIFENL